MRKRKECYKRLAIILILILMMSNAGFSPNVYAANPGSTSNSSPASSLSEKDDGSVLTGSLTDQIYGTEASPEPEPQNNSLTGNVYGEKVDKEIDYPAFPNTPLSSDKQAFQAGGVFMRHVVHMPKVEEKPAPFTPSNDRILNEQNPAVNQNINNPGIAGPPQRIVPASPDTMAISSLQEGIVDENDLNLADTDPAVNRDQGGTGVTDSVYNGSFPIRNKAGYFTVGFSRRAGGSLFRFSLKNANLTLSPLNPASVSGSIYKNSILYEGIYPDTDLRYTVEQFRLKEEIVVKKYTGKSDFSFQLGVENAVSKVMPDSTILFSDPASGQPLFYMPRGYAVDSNGNRCDSVSLEFRKTVC